MHLLSCGFSMYLWWTRVMCRVVLSRSVRFVSCLVSLVLVRHTRFFVVLFALVFGTSPPVLSLPPLLSFGKVLYHSLFSSGRGRFFLKERESVFRAPTSMG